MSAIDLDLPDQESPDFTARMCELTCACILVWQKNPNLSHNEEFQLNLASLLVSLTQYADHMIDHGASQQDKTELASYFVEITSTIDTLDPDFPAAYQMKMRIPLLTNI
jgi:hypothetical protein